MALKIAELAAPADEKLAVRKPRVTERDETQKDVDARTGRAAQAWKTMPNHDKTAPETRPRVRLAVDPDDKTELKRIIRRAATLHQVDPVYFRDATDDKGRAVVTYTVGPKKPPKKKD